MPAQQQPAVFRGLFSNLEAMKYMGLGRRKFYEEIVHDKTVPRVRIGTRVLWRPQDLDAWAERHLIAGDDHRAVLNRGRGRKKRSAKTKPTTGGDAA